MTTSDILFVASEEAIEQLHDICDAADCTKEQRCAAEIAVNALLALRDTVKRPEIKSLYEHRIEMISEALALIRSPLQLPQSASQVGSAQKPPQ